MPKLFARQQTGASGVLWAPRQTGTIQGILTLSTGMAPSGLAAIGLMSSDRFAGWTIFDDVAARGENVFMVDPFGCRCSGIAVKGISVKRVTGPIFVKKTLKAWRIRSRPCCQIALPRSAWSTSPRRTWRRTSTGRSALNTRRC